jgi:hypothetical protein
MRFVHQSATSRYALDDLRVYARALAPLEVEAIAASRWRDADVAGLGADPVVRATWSATLPAGLEGYYDVKSRGSDRAGNVDLEPGAGWTGLVDTRAPRLLAGSYAVGSRAIDFELDFEDFNLDMGTLDLPGNCSADVTFRPTPYRSPWHLALADQLTGEAADRVRDWTSRVAITCRATQAQTDETFGVCDRAGNCLQLRYPGPGIGTVPRTPVPGPTVAIATPTRPGAPTTVPRPTRTPDGPKEAPPPLYLPALDTD